MYGNDQAAVVARQRLYAAARQIQPLEVACPTCKAAPEGPCTIGRKQHDGDEHLLRRLAAQRATERARSEAAEAYLAFIEAVEADAPVQTSPNRIGLLIDNGLVDTERRASVSEVSAK